MKLFVGVKGLVTRPDGKILIVREGSGYLDKNQLEPDKWDVVGGRIEPDEKLLDGLAREIKEESGLEVEIGPLLDVRENFPSIRGELVHVIRVYHECHTDLDKITLSGDHDAYEWIKPQEAENYALRIEVQEVIEKYLNLKKK